MTLRIRDVRYDHGETQHRHGHDEVQISVIVRGTLQEDVGGVAYRGEVGDVVVKPAGTLHANEFDATRIVCFDADPDELDVPLGAYVWHRDASVTATAMRVAVCALRGDVCRQHVDDLLGALAPAPDAVLARKAARLIDEHFAAIGIDALAQHLGVHRVYLARVFRAQWRCSPREYLQRARIRVAMRRLVSTNAPLADIALDAGFSDQAHMTRVFGALIGATPASVRRAVGLPPHS